MHVTGSHVPATASWGDPCQGVLLTGNYRSREKSSALRDYGSRTGTGRYCIKALQQDQEQDVALNSGRTALADVGGLFERVAQLQYAPVVVVTAHDLHANRKAAG